VIGIVQGGTPEWVLPGLLPDIPSAAGTMQDQAHESIL